MQNKDKMMMSIVQEDGSIDEVEVVIAFEFKDTKREYVVYTKNERDENGNITVYVSRLASSVTRLLTNPTCPIPSNLFSPSQYIRLLFSS